MNETRPAAAGRTVGEVLSDPAHADMVVQAAEAFRAAADAGNLDEQFRHFSRGVDLMRQINAAEIARRVIL